MIKKMTQLVSLLIVLVLVLSACGSSGDSKEADKEKDSSQETTKPKDEDKETETGEDEELAEGELPRDKTIYFGGLQWGAINGWNPLSDDMNNYMAINQTSSGTRVTMFETLYMYNLLDGSLTPLLADGDYKITDDLKEITVKMNSAATWSDGSKVTAYDVEATFAAIVKHGNAQGSSLEPYVESVVAVDDLTVLITAVLDDDGNVKNPLVVKDYLSRIYVLQKKWLDTIDERHSGDATEIKKDSAEDVVYSGAYGPYYNDDQKVILVRNDDYWGQDASMWGKLAEPKYLAHVFYADNAAVETAFKEGNIDVDQQFIPNIQNLWLEDELPISTYMQEAPYGICTNMPTAYYNLGIPALNNVAIRKAIALAVDYDAINANAMTNQSPTFNQVPRSLMNPTDGEQASFDHDAVKDLQWAGNDIDGANDLLDAAGIVDSDGDGIRELDGENIALSASCPNGWSDWMAAMEIVAAAGEKIGIDITTNFPEWSVYHTVITAATQDQYDIFMMWTDASAPTQPWGRVRQLLSSEYVGVEGNWSGNWGQYSNERADELIQLIPAETDPVALKAYYTEAVEIYLTDVPSFSLMYRPGSFHAVNETIWTNYPDSEDGKNIPPLNLIDGYGITGLYEVETLN